ncbi:putative 2-nitropropane dioxygenase [Gordonia polyisoprenivorans NBRC 16320 = JCM 10675]|uniref:Propionate 3-nitronate monooxygenase n=1 Tax=Gordonia polyisoprenivorans TaxID=84595 RepID=A0A846WN16_9ACTN|nr:nitronate monooxygenase [Gordonia polyisoprenivorans]NKY02985.1 nitronate monooxygenase [Gordonia polyisoprenivorans]GAB22133.1 putative 2-nitropropane dioxygenase [Gordonia polyisoprenivorans NBRC 16320 = JCM 10675]
MFDLRDLEVPIIAAPMAGGPSTPGLVIAAGHGGGIGFLAAGYKSPELLESEITAVAEAGIPFGVNIFTPGPPIRDRGAVQRYRDALAPVAERYGVHLPDIVDADDDHFDAKIDLVIERRVGLVSFTFGLPSVDVVGRLHDAGITVIATVASVADADRAVAVGVDVLCVQGTEAGGHRGTLDLDATPNDTPTVDLVREVVSRNEVPVIAAGGVGDGRAVAAALASGATAVQIGTALLDSDEAGTNGVHRAALRSPSSAETVVTRAFSGRPARALRNSFVDTYDSLAPAEYPAVHHLTSPLRRAAVAAGERRDVNLWAGTSFASIRGGSASDIIAELWSDAQRGPEPVP